MRKKYLRREKLGQITGLTGGVAGSMAGLAGPPPLYRNFSI
jgi:hypothetical protein